MQCCTIRQEHEGTVCFFPPLFLFFLFPSLCSRYTAQEDIFFERRSARFKDSAVCDVEEHEGEATSSRACGSSLPLFADPGQAWPCVPSGRGVKVRDQQSVWPEGDEAKMLLQVRESVRERFSVRFKPPDHLGVYTVKDLSWARPAGFLKGCFALMKEVRIKFLFFC